MFDSFFPKPRLFFLSFAIWALLCVTGWYTLVQDLGSTLSLAYFFGVDFPATLSAEADAAAQAAFQSTQSTALNYWLCQYMAVCYGLFIAGWMIYGGQKWAKWSVAGSALIMFITWFHVQVGVWINEWYGTFYDLIQKSLTTPGEVTLQEYFFQLSSVTVIVLISMTVSIFKSFFISHYVFRWRTAMNNAYTKKWGNVRHIEGASQRIQEDTMRFASIVEGLGVRFLDSIMTLIAFLPILWTLSSYVKELPLIGEVPQALVFVAILWSAFGTALLAISGIKLPGLEFNNQKVEAAYRKELVYGEDHVERAEPEHLKELFSGVRQNYFKLYFHYLYFNVVRYSYLGFGQFIPFIALGPSIVAGAFTLGIMQRIISAFNQVEGSFQFLVSSWTTIVELLSIHKRLKAFEKEIGENEASMTIDNA
ncbi:peptide antibiotic transporter SbmA [Marinomonas mediterranea]|uniref:SbmABacA family protein n=1 Tax=Marinomonas mediterranea (strain ATCC 700492 / JCM 21426 / NBRC 103028 / MMB-1) TaxID=717774 RepID=F2K4W1_MARM1|nr:peptide antibiotic transporter SbmA [Marinomonas mediterranea]ADZ92604.1 SbmABacA family protein [Marinomonas mediterranea MMB-1]WCN14594.1 peptide antibiotic transporter SbmA [Marinomonas mediterranea]WCN18642.1 peptide antibiotic transporter SbmA [Marinomonas mediterranea MMB-1]